jgi:hypothetical protein
MPGFAEQHAYGITAVNAPVIYLHRPSAAKSLVFKTTASNKYSQRPRHFETNPDRISIIAIEETQSQARPQQIYIAAATIDGIVKFGSHGVKLKG